MKQTIIIPSKIAKLGVDDNNKILISFFKLQGFEPPIVILEYNDKKLIAYNKDDLTLKDEAMLTWFSKETIENNKIIFATNRSIKIAK